MGQFEPSYPLNPIEAPRSPLSFSFCKRREKVPTTNAKKGEQSRDNRGIELVRSDPTMGGRELMAVKCPVWPTVEHGGQLFITSWALGSL